MEGVWREGDGRLLRSVLRGQGWQSQNGCDSVPVRRNEQMCKKLAVPE